MAGIGANGFVVAIAVAITAVPGPVAALAQMVLAQAFGAPVLLGYNL
jgi:hypothetical protein